MSPATFVVIGGGIRGRVFAQTVAQHPGAELGGICETDPARATALEKEFGVPVGPHLGRLAEIGVSPTAVIVATPDFAHRAPVVDALRAGLHVLVEKPLAMTIEDLDAITEAARTSTGLAMVGFENRWNPLFSAAKDQLASSGAHVLSQRALLQDTIQVPTKMLRWAERSSPAWFLMPHSLDMAMWLGNSTPVEVYGRAVKKYLPTLGIDTFDHVSASFAMSDGSILDLDSGWVQPESRPSVFDFRHEITTDEDSYTFQIDASGAHHYTRSTAMNFSPATVDRRGRPTGPQAEMTRDFIDAVLSADIDLPGLDQGGLVSRALIALHRSLESGTPQPIGV